MHKEYIDREYYCNNICRCPGTECDKTKCPIWIAPAADVAPVVHGEWIKTSEFMPIYGCSVCKERNLFKNGQNVLSNYCPNCGAKMDGGKK